MRLHFFFFFNFKKSILINACVVKLIHTPFEKACNPKGATVMSVELGTLSHTLCLKPIEPQPCKLNEITLIFLLD